MQILNPNITYQGFFEKLRESAQSLLLLDYDGTLSPFTTDREKAKPYDGVAPLIRSINDVGRTRVIIISGRSVDVLRRLIGDELNCELWGSHGAERFAGEKLTFAIGDPEKIENGLAAIDRWAGENDLEQYLERKPLGRAVHWRGESKEKIATIKDTVASEWSTKVTGYGLSLHEFDGGIELRPAGISKATAVATVLSEYDDDVKLAYLGDDLTDEDAFVAIADRGLKVLVRAEMRETAADVRLTPPHEMIRFLENWLRSVST